MSHNGAVGIAEAAKLLGMSPAALRKRVHRGTIPSYKGSDGVWYIKVDEVTKTPEQPAPPPNGPVGHPASQDASYANVEPLVASLRDEVEFLREELRQRNDELRDRSDELKRRDVMIMEMTRRIPELPAQVESPKETPQPEPKTWWERLTSWV